MRFLIRFVAGFLPLVLLLSAVFPLRAAERIVAAGIEGTLLLCGGEGEAAYDRFRGLAGEGRRIVLLIRAADGEGLAETLSAEVVRCETRAELEAATVEWGKAEGVWISGGGLKEVLEVLKGSNVEGELRRLLGRGGVVAVAGEAVGVVSSWALAGDDLMEATGLLPDSVVVVVGTGQSAELREKLFGILKEKPGLVGYEIEAGEVLQVQGRRLTTLAGGVGVHLGEGRLRPAVRRVVTEERRMDLTALRRAARVRGGEGFPPAKPADPVLLKGTLIPIGGGRTPEGLMARFIELAGGSEARIVVVPTAAPDPLPERDGMARFFEQAGVERVTLLRGRTLAEVDGKESLEALETATGIWFGGGRQWRFVDAYEGTKALGLMQRVLDRGGVIAGSSAGASIQGEYMVRGNPLGNLDIMAEGYEEGLGFFKGAAIDQHFSQRQRGSDMESLVERYPQLLGIGIDEGTALVVQGRLAEVVGAGAVFFYDGRKPGADDGAPAVVKLGEGGIYDLAEWKEASPETVRRSRERMSTARIYADGLRWRALGPASMGGRIVDLEVVGSDPSTYYVGTAAGGIFKTGNNGVTFEPVFDEAGSLSIGDVAVAPSDPRVVWAGTGEPNGRNSVSWGDGVYKSVDGGKRWERKGLEKSHQIGRVLIDPRDPNVVWVGAVGRLWGDNEDRGVYKTTDGGASWGKVLYVDDATGCVDLAMHPGNPDLLLAAMYERRRDAFDGGAPAKRWGKGSGLHRSTDGGASWTRLTNGLPGVALGRIGIKWSLSEPGTVYAVVESEWVGRGDPEEAKKPKPAFMGIQGGESAEDGAGAILAAIIEGGAAAKAGLRAGDVVFSADGEEVRSYEDLLGHIRRHVAGDLVRMKVRRGGEELELELTYLAREQSERPFTSSQGGQMANVQDRQGVDGFQTGGVFRSDDAGETWHRVNSLTPRPFYYSKLFVDPGNVERLFVLGISVHLSEDGGKTFKETPRGIHADYHAMWIDPADGRHLILGSDGGLYVSHDRALSWEFVHTLPIGQFYHVVVDREPLYNIYGGLQDNGSWGGPSAMRGVRGPAATDWFQIGGGDGFVCGVDPEDPNLVYYELQWGRMGRLDLATGRRSAIAPVPEEGKTFRFGWKTPFMLSHHNSKIFYCAGDHVFRSLNEGRNLKRISPRLAVQEGASATAFAESPRDPDVLWVGTDDGQLWVTVDGGGEWSNVTGALGLPGERRVSSLEASRYGAGRVYVALDGHFHDDDAAHVLVSEDYGKSFRSLRANLPEVPVKTLREDISSPQVLYLGSEFGAWLSVDRGRSWSRFGNNLPRLPVHELAQHRASGELIAGTHGRGIWIADVSPLRQMNPETLEAKSHLFEPGPATLWAGGIGGGERGAKHFFGENRPQGASIFYQLTEPVQEPRLQVMDLDGQLIREFRVKGEVGLHRVIWDLRSDGRRRRVVEPGSYRILLRAGAVELSSRVTVGVDPEFPEAMTLLELEEEQELLGEQEEEGGEFEGRASNVD